MERDFVKTLASPEWRLQNLYKIKSKQKKTIALRPNHAQQTIIETLNRLRREGRPIRLLVLKARQLGVTTIFCLRYLDQAYWNKNQFAAIVAHRPDKAKEIFTEMVRFAYDNLPRELKFQAYNDSVNQLGWRSLGSQVKVTTDTHGITPNLLHLTEVARMKGAKELIGEALQSVPRDGEVIQESTAAGKGGYFWDCCEEAKQPDSYWQFVFLEWWKQDEYCLPVPKEFLLTEEEKDLLGRFKDQGLTLGNLVFRREKIKEMLSDKKDTETGLTGEMLFKQNYPMMPDEAFITSALSIFNIESLEWMRNQPFPPLAVEQWGNGWLKVYNEKASNGQYVIACDPSYGESECYSVALVLERRSGQILAKLRGKYLPYDIANYLYKLGRFYNNALIIVERNTGHAVLNELMNHLDYNEIYRHREYREGDGRPGFPTTTKTRGVMLAELEKSILQRDPVIPDKEIIEECLNFGYENGKAQAVVGNDDCVMALAIGNYLCQQPNMILYPTGKLEKPAGL